MSAMPSVDPGDLTAVTADRDALLCAYAAVVPIFAHELVALHSAQGQAIADRLEEMSLELSADALTDLSSAVMDALDEWATRPATHGRAAA